MKKRIILYTLATLLLLPTSLFARDTDKTKKNRKKSLVTNGEIHANNVKGIIANNGWLFWGGGASGFVTPSPVFKDNSGNFATVFASGLWMVGTVNGEQRAAIANYVTDFIPGIWEEYQADDVANGRENPDYIVYYHYSDGHLLYLHSLLSQEDQTADQRIHTFAQEEIDKANFYNAIWDTKAVPQGALPNPPGDVAAFTVYHDADPDQRETNGISEFPMNLQVKMTAFAFRSSDAVNNAVYIQMEFINKNNVPITDVYATVWSDPDVGQYEDDFVGSDRELGLGYAYNGLPADAQYTDVLGLAPPAVGYDYFQGPIIDSVGVNIVGRSAPGNHDMTVYINLDDDYVPNPNTVEVVIPNKYVRPATGFFFYNNGEEAGTPDEYKWFAKNRSITGGFVIPQQNALNSGIVTDTADLDWAYGGDPVTGEGWIDSDPNDRRFILNNGPFQLGVSDGTQTFGDPGYNATVFGVFSSFGSNNLTSVAVLKFEDQFIQNAYNNAFVVRVAAPAPIVSVYPSDRQLDFVWEPGTKELGDGTIITTEKYGLEGYIFEGYQIVQFESAATSNTENFQTVATYDVINDVRNIEQPGIDQNTGGLGNFIIARGTNSGVKKSITITDDIFNNRNRLLNNNFYAFGVRAYYYNPTPGDGATKGVFSEWAIGISQLSPRLLELGTVLENENGDALEAGADVTVDYTASGGSDGLALVSIFDPYKTTSSSYSVKFETLPERRYHLGYNEGTYPDSIDAGTLVWYLEKDGVKIEYNDTTDWFLPQGATGDEFNYDLYYDGLRIAVTGPPADFKEFTVVANANGAIDPPEIGNFAFNGNGFPFYNGADRPDGSRQQANGSTWGWHMADFWMTDHGDASYSLFREDAGYYMGGINGGLAPGAAEGTGIFHAVPNDYEVRFTATGGKALMRNNSGAQTRIVIDVPFEIWNVGPDPTDTSDDYRMAPFVYDRDNTNTWNMLQTDHAVSGGDNDPQMEGITFLDVTDKTPGQSGYDALIAAATADAASSWSTSVTAFPYAYNSTYHTVGFNFLSLVNWNGGSVSDATWPANVDATVPETGSVFRISMGKINTAATVFNFDGPGEAIIANQALQLKNFDKVNVFPNPYYGYHAQQNAKDGNFITFNNLPSVSGNDAVNVTIYSLGGQKVKSLKYENNQSTILKWFLTNDQEVKVASGVYIAVLKYKSETVIKKMLIFQGEQRLKTF